MVWIDLNQRCCHSKPIGSPRMANGSPCLFTSSMVPKSNMLAHSCFDSHNLKITSRNQLENQKNVRIHKIDNSRHLQSWFIPQNPFSNAYHLDIVGWVTNNLFYPSCSWGTTRWVGAYLPETRGLVGDLHFIGTMVYGGVEFKDGIGIKHVVYWFVSCGCLL